MDEVLQQQIDYYRARAGEYDDFWLRRGRYALSPDLQARWIADAAETESFVIGAVRPGARVLELAAGTGLFTQLLARRAASVHCVDASPETLGLNRARPRNSDAIVTYEVADLFSWTPSGTYDVVAFTFWLSHVPDDRLAAFWDMVGSALEPDGTVVFVDSQAHPPPVGPTASTAALERRELRDGREYRIVKRYWSPPELNADLAARGWLAAARPATHRLVMYGSARRSRPDAAALLHAYDEQLRTEAEVRTAVAVTRLGPLLLARFGSGRGFVTYRDLAGADLPTIREWLLRVREHFASEEVTEVEWKTRGHDRVPGLVEALGEAGFVPEDDESIMVGPAAALTAEVALPAGVTLRTIRSESDVRAMSAMTDRVFGDPVSPDRADRLLRMLDDDSGIELWVAEAEGAMVSSGRLEPVPGTDFAGLWGGSTVAEWRGRGIYRALTAARARSALRLGKSLLHSDSTELSRPILERSGLVKVSTTRPYVWRPPTFDSPVILGSHG